MNSEVISTPNTVVVGKSEVSYVAVDSTEKVYTSQTEATVVSVSNDERVLVESNDVTLVVSGLMGPQGVPGVPEEDQMYSKRVDFVDDNNIYRGEAPVGSGESIGVWRIRKIVIAQDGDVTETWASGTADFNKQWSLRATYNYS